MENLADSTRRHSGLRRILRTAGLVPLWAGAILLGAFGIVFAFANYPASGIAFVLLTLLLAGYSERRRRARWKAAERARRRDREMRSTVND